MGSKHGTTSRYTNGGCRCDSCKQAQREYMKQRAEKATKLGVHGLHSTYNAGCRCEACREARRKYHDEYSRKVADNIEHGTWLAYSFGKCRCDNCKTAGKFYISLRKYGVDEAEYFRMLNDQNGKCAACGQEPDNKVGFHIDHDHKTGSVRGLLCHSCNVTLGHVKDDQKRLDDLIRYLRRTKL